MQMLEVTHRVGAQTLKHLSDILLVLKLLELLKQSQESMTVMARMNAKDRADASQAMLDAKEKILVRVKAAALPTSK